MAEVSGWGTLDRAKERDGSGQVGPEEGPEDSLVLGLETLASLSLGRSGREQAAQASNPGVLTTGVRDHRLGTFLCIPLPPFSGSKSWAWSGTLVLSHCPPALVLIAHRGAWA